MSAPRIAILGAGSFGTALAILIARKQAAVTIWAHRAEHVEELRRTRENTAYLPGVQLPEPIAFTSDLASLQTAEIILSVLPSRATREVAQQLAGAIEGTGKIIVSCTKGIERGTGLRMSEILSETLPAATVAALSGPSHAEEVCLGMPTAVVLACADEAAGKSLQTLLNGSSFRVYLSTDMPGVELGGALKNIFAIGAGICDGLGLGDNSKAALVTRSLAEMARLGSRLGGRPETFQGLSGIGDLMVTCFSQLSRNRRVGERIGRGESLAQINASMTMVAEGIPTARNAFERAQALGLETPVIAQIKRILYDDLPVRQGLRELMERDPKAE